MDDRANPAEGMDRRKGNTCLARLFLYRAGGRDLFHLVHFWESVRDAFRLADLCCLGRWPPPSLFRASPQSLANPGFLGLEDLLDISGARFYVVLFGHWRHAHNPDLVEIHSCWIIDRR